ncbi:MAG TPA: homoserine kinase, partial [Chloroflexota bacterium]
HPDNSSAATLGGITAAFCESGEVHALQVVSHMTVGVALFIPDAPLPTVEARAILPEQVPIADAIHNIGHSAYLIAALTWGRLDHIGAAMRDRLHQPYRTRLIPALQDVIAAAVDAGAYGAALSGGGPSVIALGPRNQIDAIASAMESRAHDVDWRGCSIVSQIRARGVQVKEE